MKVYTYPQAKEHLEELLDLARREEVLIHLTEGETYSVTLKKNRNKSPLDVRGIRTKATTTDILEAIRESRER